MLLPEAFLRWNYFPRGKALKEMVQGSNIEDMNQFLLESVRHNPAMCAAFKKDDGSISVNAKIVGLGYVLRNELLNLGVKAFKEHAKYGDRLFEKATTRDEKDKAVSDYQTRGAKLLTEHVYFDRFEEAEKHVDFGKMATIELSLSKPDSSKHTWQIVQHSPSVCLLFYQPPTTSFEIRGSVEIHENDDYHEFVNLVHDSFHYALPAKGGSDRRPVYVINVEEVYDNSATQTGFGTRIV